MKRQTLFNIHFYLSSFFTPFLLLMAITGTSYLLGYKGSNDTLQLKENIVFSSKESKKSEIKNILSEIDKDYSYESVKDRGSSLQTRPTTRDYYQFKQSPNGSFTLSKVTPNLLSRVIEVHKGHGPALLKNFQKVLGICLMFIIFTGLLMSLKIKGRAKAFIISTSLGSVVLLILFLL